MNELVKFITQEFVRYAVTPQEERKKQRQERKEERGPWHYYWFGLVPAALAMFFRSAFKVWVAFSKGWVSR